MQPLFRSALFKISNVYPRDKPFHYIFSSCLKIHKSATFHSTPLIKNQKPRQLDENLQLPPKSDTIVPTPKEAAFRNMFDDSLIRSWTMIRKVTKYGFITSNDLRVRGPVILINGSLFLWNVPQGSFGQDKNRIDGVFDEWNKDFLKIFEIITPKPELLIFGTGKMSVPIPLKIRDYIHKLGLQIEYSDTDNAVSTFNILAEEGRNVAAAFLTINPTRYKPSDPNE